MNIVRKNEIKFLKIVIHFMLVKQTYIIIYLFIISELIVNETFRCLVKNFAN